MTKKQEKIRKSAFLLTTPAKTAGTLQNIAQAELPEVALHMDAPVIAGLLPIGIAAIFNKLQRPEEMDIVRLHGHCPADMLQSRHIVAQAVVCHR